MSLEVKRKPGEEPLSLVYRFLKRFSQSGIMREAKKRLRKDRNISESKKKERALYRERKKKEIEFLKKAGKIP
jgi:hypothetical protein